MNKDNSSQPLIVILDDNHASETLSVDDQALYIEIVAYVRPLRRIRVSILQREFVLGYNKALRMMARMQQEGVVQHLPSEAYWKVMV